MSLFLPKVAAVDNLIYMARLYKKESVIPYVLGPGGLHYKGLPKMGIHFITIRYEIPKGFPFP